MCLQIRRVPAVLVSFLYEGEEPNVDSFRASAVGITHPVHCLASCLRDFKTDVQVRPIVKLPALVIPWLGCGEISSG
jgi:hypothetical protein